MPYIINSKTYGLIPIKNNTRVIEEQKVIIIKENLNEIISYNCYLYGSTLEGRQKGSGRLIGTQYKPPIILNEKANIVLIPTHSSRNNNCSWFNLSSILTYYPCGSRVSMLEFKNSKKIIINVSYSVLDKQVLKATRLESILRGRNNKKYL